MLMDNVGACLVVYYVAVGSRVVGLTPIVHFARRVRVLTPLWATNTPEILMNISWGTSWGSDPATL